MDVTKLLKGLEELIYTIFSWIYFAPKTLVKIIFNPSWVDGYISEQLKEKDENSFKSYMSPVMLMLLIVSTQAYLFGEEIISLILPGINSNELSFETKALAFGYSILLLPFLLSIGYMFTVKRKGETISDVSLKCTFYIQTAYYIPAQVLFILIFLLSKKVQLTENEVYILMIIPYVLLFVFEVKLFSKKLEINVLSAIGKFSLVFVLCFVIQTIVSVAALTCLTPKPKIHKKTELIEKTGGKILIKTNESCYNEFKIGNNVFKWHKINVELQNLMDHPISIMGYRVYSDVTDEEILGYQTAPDSIMIIKPGEVRQFQVRSKNVTEQMQLHINSLKMKEYATVERVVLITSEGELPGVSVDSVRNCLTPIIIGRK